MTPYWRLARFVRRLLPDDWIRGWSLDYVRSRGGTTYYPDEVRCDCVLLPMRELRIEHLTTGDVPNTLDVNRGDTVELSMPNGMAGFNLYFKGVPSKGLHKL